MHQWRIKLRSAFLAPNAGRMILKLCSRVRQPISRAGRTLTALAAISAVKDAAMRVEL
jgi:hypothetical protein